MPNQYRYIDTQASWDDAADSLQHASQLALDTERNGRFAYQERICLIQLCDGEQTLLIDSLAIDDLSSFGAMLADESIVKVIHGCEEDVRFFDHDFGFTINNLFDTGLAARFLGVSRPNLGAVLEEFAGVTIPKDRNLQMSHWGLRPLSGPALDYAASDVHHLLPLADELEYRLQKMDRMDWVYEECLRLQELRYPPLEPLETAFRRIKGWDALNPRQAAILQELYAFRDGKACSWDLPPTVAASNDDLLQLAQSDGPVRRGIGGLLANRCYGELLDAIEQGRRNPEVHKPSRPDHGNDLWTSERRGRLRLLKSWRSSLSDQLTLAVSHIWPTASLERIAMDPNVLEHELAGGDGEVRRWQRDEFGTDLQHLAYDQDWQ